MSCQEVPADCRRKDTGSLVDLVAEMPKTFLLINQNETFEFYEHVQVVLNYIILGEF